MIIVLLGWDGWCCWQPPLKTSMICLYQPLESLIWAAPSHFLYLLCFFHLFLILFPNLLNKKTLSYNYESLGKGTCICLWTFQSCTDSVIVTQALSEDCIWCLSDAHCVSLPHSNVRQLEVANQEITVNGSLVYSWVSFGSENYLCLIAIFRCVFKYIK